MIFKSCKRRRENARQRKQRKEMKTENEAAERNERSKLEMDIENLNMHVICLKRRAGILEDTHQLFADSVQKSMALHIETVKIMKIGFDSTIKRLLTLIEGCPELNNESNSNDSECTSNGLSNREKLLQGLSPKNTSEKTSANLLKLKKLLLAVQPENNESQTNNVENTQENPPTERPITPDIVVVEEISTNPENSGSNSESEEEKEENFDVFTPKTVRNLKRLFSMMKSETSD